MNRIVTSLLSAAALVGVAGAAHAQSLVGTWSTTVNWNTAGGVMITSSFTANGEVQSTTQNHDGQSYMLTGVYQLQNGVLEYKWTDYAPKQICTLICSAAPVPAPMNVVYSQTIQWMNANQFESTQSGVSAIWVRSNAAGVPTP